MFNIEVEKLHTFLSKDTNKEGKYKIGIVNFMEDSGHRIRCRQILRKNLRFSFMKKKCGDVDLAFNVKFYRNILKEFVKSNAKLLVSNFV